MRYDITRLLEELKSLPKDQQVSMQIPNDGGEYDDNYGTGFGHGLHHSSTELTLCHRPTPYMNSIIKELNLFRARIMIMPPKTCYSYHLDPVNRVHIPLVTNPDCFFVIQDEVVRAANVGEPYFINTRTTHTFVNASWYERIHLIGDTLEDGPYWI